ncbi:MAG: DUF4249 family protein [Salinivirgaceae bacterium]|nr:DUF4249 family protein [Salinivirgaceae bacterium]
MHIFFKRAVSLHLIATALFSYLFITACTEDEISLDLKNAGNPYQIAVDGGVFSYGGHQFLKLTVPFEQNGKAKPASGAKVEVSDGQNTYQYRETEKEGEYESVEEFAGEVGKVYTLKIEYNGNTYFASDSMVAATEIELEQIPAGEQTKYMKIEHWRDGEVVFCDFASIELSKHKFGCVETARWIFRDIETDYYVKTPKNLVLYDHCYSHESSIPQGVFPMATWGSGAAYNESAQPIQCVKMSMSDRYYDYLVSTFNLTDWSGGMFSTISGNVKTNLSKGGTGYFYASDVKIRYLDLDELLEIIEMFGNKELSDDYEKQ